MDGELETLTDAEEESVTDAEEESVSVTGAEETDSGEVQTVIVYAETAPQADYTAYIEMQTGILSSMQATLNVIMTCVMLAWVHLMTRRRRKQ